MPTHPDWTSLTASFCWPLLTAPLHHPSPTAFSEFLFPTLLTGVPLPTSGHVEDLELRPLFGFAPKQTKRSSAWHTPFIVSHLNLMIDDCKKLGQNMGGPPGTFSINISFKKKHLAWHHAEIFCLFSPHVFDNLLRDWWWSYSQSERCLWKYLKR